MKIRTPQIMPVALLLLLGACTPGQQSDAGPERKDAGPQLDSGPDDDAGLPSDDGGPQEGDAGPSEGDAGQGDAGPPPDAGIDAGSDAGPPVDDEAGDLTDPIDVELPYSGVFDLVPAGDSDCVRFTVPNAGVLLAEGSNVESDQCTGASGGTSRDTELFLYLDGETNSSSELENNDQGGPGDCPRLQHTIGAGTYVVCTEHWSRYSPKIVYGAILDLEFSPFLCGNGVVELGEECDGVEGCTGGCLFDDGLPRENEAAGNGSAGAAGVVDMELRETYRGQVSSAADEDWWRLELPGGVGPGAVEVYVGGPDTDASSCGSANGLRLDLFGAGDLSEPVGSSRTAAPCRVVTLTSLLGDIIFGNELLYVRVRTAGDATPYHLYATYIEEDCGDGVVQPSEECEPGVGGNGSLCNENTCRLERPSNDLCNQAEDISAAITDDGSVVSFEGSTETATNATSYTGTHSCHSSTSNHVDVHYTFVAPITGRMVFVLDTPGWSAAIYATEGVCGEPVICEDNPEEIEVEVTAGERYTIVIDSDYSGKGPFTLDVFYLEPPVNDTCEAATTMTLPDDGTPVSVSGTTRGAADTSSSDECSHSSLYDHRDVFYTFTAPVDGPVAVSLDGNYTSPRVYARQSCESVELDCGPSSLDFDVTAGTSYVLVVDAYGSGTGEYELSVRYDFPPPSLDGGATCEVATALPASSGFIVGNLDGMGEDYDADDYGDCTGYASIGPDTVYSIAVADGDSLTVNVEFMDADGSLYLLGDCPPSGASSCLDGHDSATSNNESVSATNSSGAEKTFWIVVDEWVTSSGTADAGEFLMEWFITAP